MTDFHNGRNQFTSNTQVALWSFEECKKSSFHCPNWLRDDVVDGLLACYQITGGVERNQVKAVVALFIDALKSYHDQKYQEDIRSALRRCQLELESFPKISQMLERIPKKQPSITSESKPPTQQEWERQRDLNLYHLNKIKQMMRDHEEASPQASKQALQRINHIV